jgi:hypothetical protein
LPTSSFRKWPPARTTAALGARHESITTLLDKDVLPVANPVARVGFRQRQAEIMCGQRRGELDGLSGEDRRVTHLRLVLGRPGLLSDIFLPCSA